MKKNKLNKSVELGFNAHRQGDLTKAKFFYKAVLKEFPKHPEVNHNMGIILLNAGNSSDALKYFEIASKYTNGNFQIWLSYVGLLHRLGRVKDARHAVVEARSNGLKGTDLAELSKVICQSASVVQDPPKEKLEHLVKVHNNGGFKLLAGLIKHLLENYPNSPILYNFYGVASKNLGDEESALASFEKAISLRPDYAEAYSNFGNFLVKIGDNHGAIQKYKKALELKPNYAEAYYNIGNALQRSKEPEQALKHYYRSIELNSNYVDSYFRIATIFDARSDFREAIENYSKVLAISPDNAEAHSNIGRIQMELGNINEAIKSLKRSLLLNSELDTSYGYLGRALMMWRLPDSDFEMEAIIQKLLQKGNFVRPKDVERSAISLIKNRSNIKLIVEDYFSNGFSKTWSEVLPQFSDIPLLLHLMHVCPLTDLEFEEIFKNARSTLLFDCLQPGGLVRTFSFHAALASQCFLNEYIYSLTEDEVLATKKLDEIVSNQLNIGQQPSPASILALASYKALYEYSWHNLLLKTPDINDIYVAQIEEPLREKNLKSKIPTFSNKTSQYPDFVKDQYEINPYPRWKQLKLNSHPISIADLAHGLQLNFVSRAVFNFEKPKILIAGCGTGQHSISTAKRFKNSHVLGIDLSFNSLAYAQRKTEELKIKNLKYMQADILSLENFDSQFDIIECGGVLHHMKDPYEGWRILTNCLKKNGIIKIGLYSKLARKHIEKIRSEIELYDAEITDSFIRGYREKLINSSEPHHKKILNSTDFFSLSNLRDLIFHVQEYRFSLPEISKCIERLGLHFCGFEMDTSLFKQKNTDLSSLYNLSTWAKYEQENPDTFASMYQFWCQKS